MRDVNYMCEAVTREAKSWWTMDDGYCSPYSLAYQTSGLDTTAGVNECRFAAKCALSNSLDLDCACQNITMCRKQVIKTCEMPYLVYPKFTPLLSPYIRMIYAIDRDWTNTKPDHIAYTGRIKCRGYQVIANSGWLVKFHEISSLYDHKQSEIFLCTRLDKNLVKNFSGPHYDINCWNHSKTVDNLPYQVSFLCEARCISKYRVRDGIKDCDGNDEYFITNNSCPQIQRHRLQCSPSELTCLLHGALGNGGPSCSNDRDEFDHTQSMVLKQNIICQRRNDPGCIYIRNYIQSSSNNDSTGASISDSTIVTDFSTTVIPFRSYCDSFFDTKSTFDESPLFCKNWICPSDEYECLSGQCISQSWVCDGEWDCNDGSDEQRVFIMNDLKEHNAKLMNLNATKNKCHQQYRFDNTPLSNICNISSEYPCFRIGIDDPFNLTHNRPCINLTQIGDGKIDCLLGLDERNRLKCAHKGMLGFNFEFNDTECGEYFRLCTHWYPWELGKNLAYDTVCFYRKQQMNEDSSDDTCHGSNDVTCLNNVCLRGAKCNGKVECPHGEDEYRCIAPGKSQLSYRWQKNSGLLRTLRIKTYPLLIPLSENNDSQDYNGRNPDLLLKIYQRNNVPNLEMPMESTNHETTVYEKKDSDTISVYNIIHRELPNGTITFEKHYLPFVCNRGIAVKYYTGHTVCFCSPSFYGSQCEFYSDRITIVTHLDLTNYRQNVNEVEVIKMLATFLFSDEIVDYHEFHVNPRIENENNYIKQNIYFLYRRTKAFLEIKTANRSGTQLYIVRFEAFNLHANEKIEPIGVWKYPIYFDFLPAFRLSKILRFRRSLASLSNDPCQDEPCGKHGICQEIFNLNSSLHHCSCNSGYYGTRCEHYTEECNNYCLPKSICKPDYRAGLTGNQYPLCLCPASRFGKSCYLRNTNCQINPCLNGGSCVVLYDFADVNKYICLCTGSFEGHFCQFPKGIVNIKIASRPFLTLKSARIVATTVSYNDYNVESLRFIVRHQQVFHDLPTNIKLIYTNTLDAHAPKVAVLKMYRENFRSTEPDYYILYFQSDRKNISIEVDLTSENRCPLYKDLWHSVQSIETPESGK